jgi:hypothetical protein
MAIDVRDHVRGRMAKDRRKAWEDALSAVLDTTKKFGLYPIVSDLVANGVRDYAGDFPTSPVGEILTKQGGAFAVPSDQVLGLFFNDGQESAEAIRAYLRANGDDPLILEEYGAYLMRQSGVVRDDGTLDRQKLTAWEIRYGVALSMLPGLRSKLAAARQAQEALEKVEADGEAALNRFRLSPAMLFVDHDPMTATKKLFALPDTATAMRSLVEMMEGNQAPIDGLRKAIVDHIRDQVGVTDDRAADYLEFLRMHDRALSIVFDNDKMQIFRDIAFSLEKETQNPRVDPLPVKIAEEERTEVQIPPNRHSPSEPPNRWKTAFWRPPKKP